MNSHKSETASGLTVSVEPADARGRDLITGMIQFYVYHFSGLAPPQKPEFDLQPNGLYSSFPGLDSYWTETDRQALVIRADRRAAGFALINTASHQGAHIDFNMGEFFVMAGFRRSGVARQAFHQIVQMSPGQWEVAIMHANAAAKAFWPDAIRSAPGVSDVACHDGDGVSWTGPIWSFRISPQSDPTALNAT